MSASQMPSSSSCSGVFLIRTFTITHSVPAGYTCRRTDDRFHGMQQSGYPLHERARRRVTVARKARRSGLGLGRSQRGARFTSGAVTAASSLRGERRKGGRRPRPLAARRPSRTAGCRSAASRDRGTAARGRARARASAPARRRSPRSRPTSRQSAGIASRWPNFASTAAADFAPQPGRPGIAVGGVADQREVVGDRRRAARRTSRSTPASSRIVARAAIQLHDARAAHALREVLVRRADDHALDARVARRRRRRRRQRIVGLELDHRPDDDAERGERLLEQRELRAADPGRCPRRSCSRATGRCGTTR